MSLVSSSRHVIGQRPRSPGINGSGSHSLFISIHPTYTGWTRLGSYRANLLCSCYFLIFFRIIKNLFLVPVQYDAYIWQLWLWQHLPNMNVVQKNIHLLLPNQKCLEQLKMEKLMNRGTHRFYPYLSALLHCTGAIIQLSQCQKSNPEVYG